MGTPVKHSAQVGRIWIYIRLVHLFCWHGYRWGHISWLIHLTQEWIQTHYTHSTLLKKADAFCESQF